MEDKALCLSCGDYVNYYLTESPRTVLYKDKEVTFLELRAYCITCNNEIDIPGLWDENLSRIQEAYKN